MNPDFHKFNFERWERMEEVNAKALDRLLEVIVTGTFALSLTLISGFGPATLLEPRLLIFSWVSFGIAILNQIIGYLVALSGFAWAKQQLLKVPIGESYTQTEGEAAVDNRIKKRYQFWSMVLRYGVLFFLTMGMIFLIWFASLNLLKKDSAISGVAFIMGST